MRTSSWLLIVIAVTSLSWACANAGATPTGPSALSVTPPTQPGPAVIHRDVPSIEGSWQVAGTAVFRNLDTGNALTYGTCSGFFVVESQDGEHFAGRLQMHGYGWNSDRFCTATGTFSGELASQDGTARATLDGNFQNWPRPSVTPSCEMIAAGDGIWTGNATSDGMSLRVRDTLRCAANVDGGIIGIPMANFERTVSLVFQRQ